MKAIQTQRVGSRNCQKHAPTVIPVPAGYDAILFMSIYLEGWMQDGYKVVGSYGNGQTFGLCKRGDADSPVLKVSLIDIEEMAEAS